MLVQSEELKADVDAAFDKHTSKLSAVAVALLLSPGNKVFLRTVTNYFTGIVLALPPEIAELIKNGASPWLEAFVKNFVPLGTAAWVADTKRWSETLSSGKVNEAEPYPGVCWVNVQSIVDGTLWTHELLTKQQ